MSNDIIALEGEFSLEEAQGWEEKVFGRVCVQGRGEAVAYLEGLEEALFGQRPAGWAVVGFRTRTLVARFG